MAKKISKQDRSFVRTAMDFERKYDFDKSFSEAMNLAESAKRQADEAYSVATNIKGIFFFIRYSAYADGTNMTEEPQADTVYMGTCSTNVDEAPTDKGAYTWTKILGNDGANGEKGEKGEDGAKGDDGVGVSNMVAQYVVTNSKTTKPTSGWSTTMPNWTTGSYLWIRHIVYYTNGDEVPTEPMCDSSWEAVNILNNTLNHDEVFKRLTNNGTQQGIYKDENGDIYINGEYVEFEGATIGGWKIGKNAIYKEVTINGTDYCVYFQPPVAGYEKTWVLSCQQRGSDGGMYGNFILFSDGSAKFGSTRISADGAINLGGMSIDTNGEMRWSDPTGRGYAPLAILREDDGKMWMQIDSVVVRDTPTDAYHATNKKYVDRHLNYTKDIDLRGSTFDQNTWYPVTAYISDSGIRRIDVHSTLSGVCKPSWCTHEAGFYANLSMLVQAGGWGTSGAYEMCLGHDYRWANDNPTGYMQLTNASIAVVYLRGGGYYTIRTDWDSAWSVQSSDFTASGQTAPLKTVSPSVNLYQVRTIGANISGNAAYAATAHAASYLTNLGTADEASSSSTKRKIWLSYADGITGRPAISDNFTYVTSTNTLHFGSGSISPTQYSGKAAGVTGMKTHVVSQGTSGGWEYRLWSNGFTELWQQTTPVPCIVSDAWGNVYVQDNAIASSAYPVTFVSYPHVVASVFSVDGNQYVSGDYFLFTGARGSTTASPHFGVMRPKAPSANISLSAQLYVCGYRVT